MAHGPASRPPGDAPTAEGARPPCPRCGRAVTGRGVRCRFCLAYLPDAEAARAPRREAGRRRWRLPRVRHRWTRTRGFAVALALLAAVLVARWAWDNYLSTPSPLPLPASASPGLEAEPLREAWPTPGGGLRQDRATEASPAIGGETAWRTELPAAVLRPPVADAERLYLTFRDSIAAYRLADGGKVWEIARPGLLSAPSIAGGRLYLALRTGHVVAVEAATGAIAWSQRLGQELFSTPIPYRGAIHVYGPGRLYGLDAADGARLWDIGVEGRRAELSPLLDDDYLVVAASKAAVVYDRATGERVFRHPHTSLTGLVLGEDRAYGVSPAFAAGIDPDSRLPWWEGTRLYWNWLWAFGAAPAPPRPDVEWVTRERPSDLLTGAGLTQLFRPAHDGERLFASDSSGLLRAFDSSTGALLWERRFESLHGPPTATPAGLVVPLAGAIGLLDPASGEQTASHPLGAIAYRVGRWVLVLGGGTIVVDAPGVALALR